MVSSNSSVVKAGRKGKIKALRCGKADVTVVLGHDSRQDKLVLHVRVKSSSYAKKGSHGQGAVQVKAEVAVELGRFFCLQV